MSKNKVSVPVIAGLDIGSTKVALVIGIPTPDGKIEVVGVGTAPNTGIRQGAVVNIEAATESIRKAREEAELMSGYQVESVWVGVSGPHIKSFDSKGMIAIKNKEVANEDIERVIEAAKAVAVPSDRSVLHVLPREYKIDDQDQILDPIGMSGVRLEASVHIVTGSQTALLNTIKCTEKAGLKVAGVVLDQLASAQTVLSEDEKSLGVCLVDIGGGTCNTVYYVNSAVAHTSMITVGGMHFSHDVAVGLRTPQASAEELKRKYGCALVSLVNENETVEVEGVGGRKARTVMRRELAEVLEPRAEETLNLILDDIKRSGHHHQMGSGVVLTGGGSQLDGMIELGEFIFDVPVRRGLPQKVGGLTDVVKSASYATSVGLLLYGYEQEKKKMKGQRADVELNESLTQLGRKIRDFFGQAF